MSEVKIDLNAMLNLMAYAMVYGAVFGFIRATLLSARRGSSPSQSSTSEPPKTQLKVPYEVLEGFGSPVYRIDRPKSFQRAVECITAGGDGWVLLAVDTDKCGACDKAKTMLEVRGLEYREVNLTDIPIGELEKFTEQYGITGVPTLLYVRGGKIIGKVEFTGKRDVDAKIVRGLDKIAAEFERKPMTVEAKAT